MVAPGREMETARGLVLAARPDDRRAELDGVGLEPRAGVALVAEDDEGPVWFTRPSSRSQTSRSSCLCEASAIAPGVPSGAIRVRRPKSPEPTAVRGAIAVVGGIRERAAERAGATALQGLPRAGALHRGRVDQEQDVVVAGAPRRKGRRNQLLDRAGQGGDDFDAERVIPAD
jgi:hypothetical protein